MIRTRRSNQTHTLAVLFLAACTIAACDVVLGIEPGISWCHGKPKGTQLPTQIDGDCQEITCDGEGNTEVRLSNDADDKNPCTIDTCVGTQPQYEWQTQHRCYEGPGGTEDVGICRGGIRQCDPITKLAVGTCAGQVLPQWEHCRNNVDDDCDGKKDQADDGCVCGDGIADPTNDEECDDGGIITGSGNICSSQCTLHPCQSGGPVVLAIDHLLLGDIDPDGTSNPTNGWKNYGFNLDGLVSTAMSTDLCKPRAGGSTDTVYPDGPDGIDNSFGKNILPILLGLAPDLSTTANETITSGEFTHMYRISSIGQIACSTSSAFFLGSNLGKPPAFDGTDVWPVDPSSVFDPNLPLLESNAKISFGTTKIIEDRVTVSGSGQFDLVLRLLGSTFTLPIWNVRLSLQLSADHTGATHGIIGGVMRTEDLVHEIAKSVAAVETSFCDPASPTLVSILNQIRQASDMMVNGGEDPNTECDGISIGLGFTMKAVQLGNVATPTKPPVDPCLPAPLCSNGSCPAPSCGNSAMPQTCGPSSNENCCISPFVPGGTYNRGNDAGYPAAVSDFHLDRFEVTVGRFRKFVDAYPGSKPLAGAGAHPKIMGSGWNAAWNTNLPADKAAMVSALKCNSSYQTWTDDAGTNEILPINCVNWHDALAFCAWDNGRLPTEAEWNYAAAGGNQQWPYPWGYAPRDPILAVYGCQGDGSALDNCAFTDILNVGSKSPLGDGLWGHADVAGSMWEWTLDLYQSPYANPCVNCANLENGTLRVMRGGSWFEKTVSSGTTNHAACIDPVDRYDVVGFRCARNP